MRNLTLLKLILSAGILMSATVFAKAIAVPEPTVYTQDKPVAMVTNEQPEFIIKLRSNPTTGYSWFLRGYNSEIIQPIKHLYQASDTKMTGAPGFELWTFKVKPSGFVVPQQTMIRFVYARPWESAETATQLMFKVTTAAK
ncbi:MAG: protease inhibitor I42 family protein [Pseudomonadota bacterium]